MIAKIFRVYDGVNHWIIAETEEEVLEVMKDYWEMTVGLDSEDAKYHIKDYEAVQMEPSEKFTMSFDSMDKLELEVGNWLTLYYMFVNPEDRKPMYWACSEW